MVPYLDILMNLILFMLLSMAGLATLGVAPARAAGRAEGGRAALGLTITVRSEAYVLEGTGLETRVIARDEQLLTSALMEVKQLYPSERDVVIRPERSVDYAVLVATLDAARETADRSVLFPNAVLAF